MPHERDLFSEEQQMVSMSFGDHIEELRVRLILGLLGLVVGVIVTFIPPLNLGQRVVNQMQEPATLALDRFYQRKTDEDIRKAKEDAAVAPPLEVKIPADSLVKQLKDLAPGLNLPDPDSLKEKKIELVMGTSAASQIEYIRQASQRQRSAVVTLGPLEGITIFFTVCTITGLVITSPWVFYQAWVFVAAGLYRHERHYVLRYMPFSIGLFLAGVLMCFYGVLPITLGFLFDFSLWLGIEPGLRLSEWMGFATLLPLVFGICFQTPLIMLLLERIGVLTVKDYKDKRKFAILIMVIIAAVLTPGPDVFSQCMLAVPMIGLYELGILLIGNRPSRSASDVA